MKFKVSKGTPLFDQLLQLKKRMQECNEAAGKLVEELGYNNYRGGHFAIAGGISSIEIPEGKPKGWKIAYQEEKDEYFPSDIKSNKELLERIEALPKVTGDDMNAIIKYDYNKTPGRQKMFHPGFVFGDDEADYILFSFRDYVVYEPIEGMEEIVSSKYNELKERLTKND